MNWKLTAGLIGGYLALSWLRKRGAITVNKDDAAGAVLDQAANQGDKIIDATAQVKAAVAAKIGSDAPVTANPRQDESDTDAALATIF